jgi:RNA polymerase primary sigma factor
MPRKLLCVYLSALPFEPAAPEPREYEENSLYGNLEVRQAISLLSVRDREVVESRYGFKDGQQKSLADIGNRLGVTRQAVQHQLKEALTKVHKLLIAHC